MEGSGQTSVPYPTRSNFGRRIIFPSIHSPRRDNQSIHMKDGCEKQGGELSDNIETTPCSSSPNSTNSTKELSSLILPLSNRPERTNNGGTGDSGHHDDLLEPTALADCSKSSSAQPAKKYNGANHPQNLEALFRGGSICSPHPTKHSVLFSSDAKKELPPLPFLPPMNMPPQARGTTAVQHGDLSLETYVQVKPESTRNSSMHAPLISYKPSPQPRFLPLPAAAPFIEIDKSILSQNAFASKSKPLPSILKRSRFIPSNHTDDSPAIESQQSGDDDSVSKISSIESDLPSLASSLTSSNASATDSPLSNEASPQADKGHDSESSKRTSFSPRVWVREFSRTPAEVEATWFTASDMDNFKMAAMQRIIVMEKQARTELIPTGTGRMVQRVVNPTNSPNSPKRALFSHKALCMDADSIPDIQLVQKRSPKVATAIPTTTPRRRESELQKKRVFRCAVAENEIRQILVVDSQDVCRDLFSKGLQKVLPHATVTAVSNADEALRLVQLKSSAAEGKRGFDVVIVEVRLKLPSMRCESGAALLRKMCNETNNTSASKTLYIGVSSQLREDSRKLQDSGSDILWPKPPPRMDQQLRDGMLKALLLKRGRSAVADTLFD